ncbi:cell division protein FtsI/penicillin-binding protein 2 [Synechococcus sp. PCC 7502]|uniref:peptidoglycan D,D-transpeptidase FtsI family protein n=1 Tax=Synechococcus sp. PCC 7502 TaxID=1173263 RepID=UPI00029F913B|nr:penicillin-binding protein 2 [Synechococcus sp. PCC 7502]AFY72306.1 cell division protein FtsI/penicillin-binding protein 2 [Synechococcus sp. PCC 7502]
MKTTAVRTTKRKTQIPEARPQSFMRLVLVWVFLVVVAIALIIRFSYLQIATSQDLQRKAALQQDRTLTPFLPRRPIIDRHGAFLAIDKPIYDLRAHPYLYKQFAPKDIAAQLAPILSEDPQKLESLLALDATTVTIKKWLSESIANQVRNISIEGIRVDGLELEEKNQRFYPQQNLAAEVIGYVNGEQKGQVGVELTQEKHLLLQTDKTIDVRQDGRGRLIPADVPEKIIRSDRSKLQLTIDENLQRIARQALQATIQKYHAKRGTVMVMDVNNGELPVLVTEPNFDPNQFYNYSKTPDVLRNWAVSDLYEPGSTFKPLNVAIALQVGAIQPDQVFYDEGSLTIGGWQVANFNYETNGGGGALTISQILQRSSNVGMVHIIQQMRPAVYYKWLQAIGLGDKSGIDLYPEEASTLKSKDIFLEQVIEPATAAFGQGLSLTPIQMLQLQGILASGGKRLTPHVVRGLVDENGKLQTIDNFKPPTQIFTPAVTKQVVDMMTSVVQEGTGKPARIPGYRLGGKTGTAQKSVNGTYVRAKITSFVGIFPAEQPKYVILAVVDEPVGADAFGSTVAAPVVKSVIEGLIVADNILPTHPEELIKAK